MSSYLLVLVFVASLIGDAATTRTVISLDGTWQLALDPSDPATARMNSAGARTAGPITVPGAWQGQGFGEPTTTMFHQCKPPPPLPPPSPARIGQRAK